MNIASGTVANNVKLIIIYNKLKGTLGLWNLGLWLGLELKLGLGWQGLWLF